MGKRASLSRRGFICGAGAAMGSAMAASLPSPVMAREKPRAPQKSPQDIIDDSHRALLRGQDYLESAGHRQRYDTRRIFCENYLKKKGYRKIETPEYQTLNRLYNDIARRHPYHSLTYKRELDAAIHPDTADKARILAQNPNAVFLNEADYQAMTRFLALKKNNDAINEKCDTYALQRDDGSYPAVIIDPGHGTLRENAKKPGHIYEDRGTGHGGLAESASNDRIAFYLARIIKAHGIALGFTRYPDELVRDGRYKGDFHSQDWRMKQPEYFLFEGYSPIYVSIHGNGSVNSRDNGAIMFYGLDTQDNLALAGALKSAFDKFSGRYGVKLASRQIEKHPNAIIVNGHRHDVPAVLVETAYLSNTGDRAALENHPEKIAETIADGIQIFLDAKYPKRKNIRHYPASNHDWLDQPYLRYQAAPKRLTL